MFAILRVHGHSMQPKIQDGQKVLMLRYFFSSPKLKDIVAFKFDNKIFIKRLHSIIEDKYFLEGDNKNDSLDSKKFGTIKRKNILGKIIWY